MLPGQCLPLDTSRSPARVLLRLPRPLLVQVGWNRVQGAPALIVGAPGNCCPSTACQGVALGHVTPGYNPASVPSRLVIEASCEGCPRGGAAVVRAEGFLGTPPGRPLLALFPANTTIDTLNCMVEGRPSQPYVCLYRLGVIGVP